MTAVGNREGCCSPALVLTILARGGWLYASFDTAAGYGMGCGEG